MTAPRSWLGLLAVGLLLGSEGCARRRELEVDPTPTVYDEVSAAEAAAARAAARSSAQKVAEGPPNFAFEVRDAATGALIPCKLSFKGVQDTPTPHFARGDHARPIDGGFAVYHRVLARTGAGSLHVPPGLYDVQVSHGIEWSVRSVEAVRIDQGVTKLPVTLAHVVSAPGWRRGDFHVHSAPSFDSVVPLDARVVEFAAEGLDLLVATDHNVATDYTPAVARQQLTRVLDVVRGSEVTTKDWGHFGAFPVPASPGGALFSGGEVSQWRPGSLFKEVRARAPGALLTVMHPRFGRIGYFNHAAYEPARGSFGRREGSLDFDAIELLNGYAHVDTPAVEPVLRDWFSLLARGHRVVMTGNSDTHRLDLNQAGYPRNYVALSQAPGAAPGAELVAALRAGRSYVTSGPLLDVQVDGAELGALVKVERATSVLKLAVRAAPWVDVRRVAVYRSLEPPLWFEVPASDQPLRFSLELPLAVEQDDFVVLRVEGDRDLAPIVGGGDALRLLPMALTNPIWLDADGDGQWTPPLPPRG